MTDSAVVASERADDQALKALSLWQPWASLVAEGVKTIETRHWSTRYRGPLAIHATKQPVMPGERVGDYKAVQDADCPPGVGSFLVRWTEHEPLDPTEKWHWMPLGAVVATCTLVDVVPTEKLYWTDLWSRWAWQGPGGSPVYPPQVDPRVHELPVVVPVKQRPFGDYTPGRFAWLLADIKRVDPPEPAKGRQGLWMWDRGSNGTS